MVDVLHHITDIQALLIEAQRCLRPGGAIAMIEPWGSSWSELIYTRLHHAPFQPEAKHWASRKRAAFGRQWSASVDRIRA